MEWTYEEKRKVWRRGSIIDGQDPSQIRKDCCDAIIKWDCYGKDNSEFGWEIDHVYPKAKLESAGVPKDDWDNLRNLRPMHHANNSSKGDDYPTYKYVVTSSGRNNVNKEGYRTVNKKQQKEIDNLYWLYLDNEDDIDN